MVRTATNHQPCDYSTTTFRASYFTPKTLAKPNWRGRTASVQFDNSDVVKIAQVSDKLASGYSSNRQHWDGTSW